MRRVLGWSVALLLAGLLAGGLAGYAAVPDPRGSGTATPVPGESPSVPTIPTKTVPPPDEDIDYPPLRTPTRFTRHTVGNGYQQWSYAYPRSWQPYCVIGASEVLIEEEDDDSSCSEIRYRPADEPVIGGYSLRVKAVNEHLSTEQMVTQKLAALENSPDLSQLKVLNQTKSTLYVTLRTGGNLERYNFFAWFAGPDSVATLEMSVAGRAVDDNGLRGLMDAFADRTRAIS